MVKKVIRNELLNRGIILARRDNCIFLREIYTELLGLIINRQPLKLALNLVYNSIRKLVNSEVDYKKLVVLRGLGANYKSKNYFLKIFSDYLAFIGKPMNPGDRLDFLIIQNSESLLGKKMRLVEQYTESLKTSEPLIIDNMYYLEKALMKPLDQLISVGYSTELEKKKDFNYTP
ncbi:DNA-directed DNA polymerase, family B, conserved region domain protein, partial [mine drainage metagenome]